MYIKSLYIEAFAGTKDKTLEFSRGLNIIEGENESGKSTVCMFIKFMLYGLSGRGSDGDISERQRYVPWDTRKASGTMNVVCAKGEYKIERELSVFEGSQPKEHVCIIDIYTGEQVFKGEVPGLAILGVDEQMFVNTVFVRQIGGAAIDGSGMTEAIENILLTGDESLSVKRATDRLDKIRKAIMPKKGAGGKLQLLAQEESRLTLKLEDAKQSSAAVIAYENESAKLAALIEKRTAERNRFDSLCRAYKVIESGRKLEKAREIEGRIEQISSKLSAIENHGDLSEKSSKINSLSARLTGIDSRIISLRSAMAEEPDESDRMTDVQKEEAREDVEKAGRARTARNACAAVSSVLLVLGIAGAALGFVFKSALKKLFIPVLASAGGAFAIGCALLVVAVISGRKLSAVLKKWDVSSCTELEDEIERRNIRAAIYQRAAEDRARRMAEAQVCEAEKNTVIGAIRDACREFVGDAIADADVLCTSAVEKATELAKMKESLGASLAMAQGELRGYSDVLGYDGGKTVEGSYKEIMQTEAGKVAYGFTTKEAAMAISKKNFAESALPGLITQKGEVDANLARVKATSEDTAVLSAQLDSAKRESAVLKKKLAAVEEATRALVSAGEGIRASLMPRVSECASEIMKGFTDGRHTEIVADRGFNLGFMEDDRKRGITQMSAGTQDAAYVSYRCAIAKVLFSADALPLVYDESFARIDEKRLENILNMLSESKMQSLVFTCRTLEGKIADKLEAASRSEL